MIFCRRRRVISEADLDREAEEAKRRADGQFDDSEDSGSESEEDDWKKPSAYSLLIGSLKKNSKQKDFYKKIKREQEGIEEADASEEELAEGEDPEFDDEELEGDEDLEGEEELEGDEDISDDEDDEDIEYAEPEDKDAADPLEEDEEEEIVYVGSDEEEEIPGK